MVYIVMPYIVMAYIVMAYIIMAYLTAQIVNRYTEKKTLGSRGWRVSEPRCTRKPWPATVGHETQ